jgi:hypothetical protein
MRIKDFERTVDGDHSLLITRVADEGGEGDFELRFAGPGKLVERMLAEATIELTVDSRQDESHVRQAVDADHQTHRRSMWEAASLTDVDSLLKPAPGHPDRRNVVLASVRPVSGEGTPFVLALSTFFVPSGFSLFFFGLPVLTASALVVPATGDQDIFVHLFSPTGPVIASSTFGGTTPDLASFFIPFLPVVPVFQVFGFTAGVCANFTATGAP